MEFSIVGETVQKVVTGGLVEYCHIDERPKLNTRVVFFLDKLGSNPEPLGCLNCSSIVVTLFDDPVEGLIMTCDSCGRVKQFQESDKMAWSPVIEET